MGGGYRVVGAAHLFNFCHLYYQGKEARPGPWPKWYLVAGNCCYPIRGRIDDLYHAVFLYIHPYRAEFFCHVYVRSEEHTSELQSRGHLVCRLLLEKKKKQI